MYFYTDFTSVSANFVIFLSTCFPVLNFETGELQKGMF